jgi:hypothetical protein
MVKKFDAARNVQPPNVAYVTPAKATVQNRSENNEVVSLWSAEISSGHRLAVA